MKHYIVTCLLIIFVSYNAHTVPFQNDTTAQRAKAPQFNGGELFSDYFTAQAQEIDFFQTRHLVNIATIKTSDNTLFIVKQDTENFLSSLFRAAREKLGVFIALSIDLEPNQVEIIPAGYSFTGKRITDFPATLHTFSHCVLITHLLPDSPFYQVNIHQDIDSAIPEKQRGLTYSTIQNMAKHRELPTIAALDTFIGNRGRHRKNYFYCAESDHFYLIDLESSFSSPLGMYACNTIQSLLDDTSFSLPPQEVIALALYNDTLKKLISLYSPKSIYEHLITNITECNPELTPKNNILEEAFTSNDIADITVEQNTTSGQSSLEPMPFRKIKKLMAEQVALYQTTIQQNYESCIQLTSLLEQLLARYP